MQESMYIAELNLDAIMLSDMLKLLAFESLMYFLRLNKRTGTCIQLTVKLG